MTCSLFMPTLRSASSSSAYNFRAFDNLNLPYPQPVLGMNCNLWEDKEEMFINRTKSVPSLKLVVSYAIILGFDISISEYEPQPAKVVALIRFRTFWPSTKSY
jgi:hypothetical protein